MIKLETKSIFNLALSPEAAATRRLEVSAEQASDLNNIEQNSGPNQDIIDNLNRLKANMSAELTNIAGKEFSKNILDV